LPSFPSFSLSTRDFFVFYLLQICHQQFLLTEIYHNACCQRCYSIDRELLDIFLGIPSFIFLPDESLQSFLSSWYIPHPWIRNSAPDQSLCWLQREFLCCSLWYFSFFNCHNLTYPFISNPCWLSFTILAYSRAKLKSSQDLLLQHCEFENARDT
jgi:hypothetical protein